MTAALALGSPTSAVRSLSKHEYPQDYGMLATEDDTVIVGTKNAQQRSFSCIRTIERKLNPAVAEFVPATQLATSVRAPQGLHQAKSVCSNSSISVADLKHLTAIRLANLPRPEATDYCIPNPTSIQSEFVARAWVVAHEYFWYRSMMVEEGRQQGQDNSQK